VKAPHLDIALLCDAQPRFHWRAASSCGLVLRDVRRLMDRTTIVAAGLGLSREYLGRFVISHCLGRSVE